MSDSRELAGFFQESIELVSTWLFDETVTLSSIATGAEEDSEGDILDLFLSEIRARHALACAATLPDIVKGIEQRASTRPRIKHTVAKDLGHGRLDIGRYVQNRPAYGYRQAKYPILEGYHSAQTPENVLVAQVLKQFAYQLGGSPFPKNKAEGRDAALYYTWARGKLKRWPWDSIQAHGDVQWLRVQTEQRLLRRRTGNDAAYAAFLQWLSEWLFDPARMHGAPGEKFTKGLLAFPTGDFFWNRVLEIWCLKITAESLSRLGYQKIYGPLPLQERGKQALYEFVKGDETLSIWFQRQKPMGSPRWQYASGRALTGIPDVLVHSTKRAPFIIDAKHKLITTDTRSDETYKMLGYLENFRHMYNADSFHCALIMSGKYLINNNLYSDKGDVLTLIGVTEKMSDRSKIEEYLDSALASWLA